MKPLQKNMRVQVITPTPQELVAKTGSEGVQGWCRQLKADRILDSQGRGPLAWLESILLEKAKSSEIRWGLSAGRCTHFGKDF